MTKEEYIQQLAEQFKANGMEKEQALEYATNQAGASDYQDWVQTVRDVFINCCK